ncbi:MAG: precorrin-6y C5,15-methyltransferase (decarboxylating) subunit CbiE [Paracoccaceae bacterium]|nr:precorrin-6y C5,15-methyltransferase (decarboxylating) subunit CbiE [Paracoccaceae bacterium]
MADPWLTIVGLGEDGLEGLPNASRAAVQTAEVIFGGPRHLDLVAAGVRGIAWPVPFDLAPVLARRGQRVVVLTSGDPFWFGAGGSLARHLAPSEWRALPVAGIFSLAAARLGWRIENSLCFGLHAASFARLRPVLARGARVICTLRDAQAPAELAQWLVQNRFGAARMIVLEALGGPRERLRSVAADAFDLTGITTPVAVALECSALPASAGQSRAAGLPDDAFAHDGQITKRPIRALTLSALAPRAGEMLWDIGGGSGSVSVEWCLMGGRAVTIEQSAARSANIAANIGSFGVDAQMTLIEGRAPGALAGLPLPDAVFVGGGGDAELYQTLLPMLSPGTRLVANSVTLETESVLAACHAQHGGTLMRIELAQAEALGGMRGWKPARPVVQWSVML